MDELRSVGGDQDALTLYRERIDRIDDEIMALLQARASIVVAVAQMKRRAGLPMRDLERERAIIERLADQPTPVLSRCGIERIMQHVFDECVNSVPAMRAYDGR